MIEEKKKSKRGFASMDRTRQKEIASLGGVAAHQHGSAHEFTSEEARVAGSRGGKAVRDKLGSEHFSKIGKVGGKVRGQQKALEAYERAAKEAKLAEQR